MRTKNLIPFLLFPFWVSGQITGSVTQGLGTTTTANLMPDCPSNHVTPYGTITSTDNKIWKVPAETNFLTGPYAADLFNACNNKTPTNLSAVDLTNIPITEIDANGDVITGFLFSDNYFELFVNGILVGVDPVPFTPFNSCVVKFRVSKPYTLAVKLVDWEENLGLGTEIQGANNFHPGDGGFIAQFSDGTVTNANWKAQTFYIAPLQDVSALVELPDGTRSTASATLTPGCSTNCYSIHYDEPADWKNESFNDSGWPNAQLYTAAQVTNQAAYTNFAGTAWGSASFIWSSNLILDNLVLARYTVPSITEKEPEVKSPQSLRIYPNPARNAITVELPKEFENGMAKLVIENSIGMKVKEWNATSGTILIQDLPPGLYQIVLSGPETAICTSFLIE